jgi:hypothetical protein
MFVGECSVLSKAARRVGAPWSDWNSGMVRAAITKRKCCATLSESCRSFRSMTRSGVEHTIWRDEPALRGFLFPPRISSSLHAPVTMVQSSSTRIRISPNCPN